MTWTVSLWLVISAAANSESPTLPLREYRTREVKLEVDVDGYRASVYGHGGLWVAPTLSEVWRFDTRGRVKKFGLQGLVEGTPVIRNIWVTGPEAVLEVADKMVAVSGSGETRVLRPLDRDFALSVPVRDGYVGLRDGSPPSLVYVGDDGTRRSVPLDALQEDGEDGGSARDEEANAPARAEASEEGKRTPCGRAASAALRTEEPPDIENGVLAPLDLDRLTYVTREPYQVHILGLDGTATCFTVDESGALPPERSAFAERKGSKLVRVDPQGLGLILPADGRLAIERRFRATFVVTGKGTGLPEGTEHVGWFSMVDIVDPTTGRLLERVDTPRIARYAGFAGLRGKDLVLAGIATPGVPPRLLFASAD